MKGITVGIATYNGETTLHRVLEAIEKQKIEGIYLEILAADGGSTDGTMEILRQHSTKIIENKSGNAIAAKSLIFQNAKYDAICYIDQDEILINPCSLRSKLEILNSNEKVFAVFSSGYKHTKQDTVINIFSSIFGDPVSQNIYDTPNLHNLRLPKIIDSFSKSIEKSEYIIFECKDMLYPILLEVVATATMICRSKSLEIGNEYLSSYDLVQLFYKATTNTQKDYQFVMLKNDPINHKSTNEYKSSKNKIEWRIMNQMNRKGDYELYESGLITREKYLKIFFTQKNMKYRRILFRFTLYQINIPRQLRRMLQIIYLTKNWKCIILPLISLRNITLLIITVFRAHFIKKDYRRYGK
jgi:glycosyltransferase involved in cell wall biosynthesis